MRAVILAAGYATRLLPYTEAFPKTLLKLGGRPLLDYTLDNLAEADLSGITVVTNERFRRLFASWARSRVTRAGAKGGPPIRVLGDGTTTNEGRLGSIGDLAFVLEREGMQEDLLVLSSDKLVSFRFADLLGAFRDHTLNTCYDTGDRELVRGRFGCARLDGQGRIVEFAEKPSAPPSSVKSIAFYVYPRAVLPLVARYLSSGGNPDAPGYFTEWLCRKVPVYAWLLREDCRDVGTPESYLEARARIVPGGEPEVRVLVVADGAGTGAPAGEALEQAVRELAGEPPVTLVYVAAPADAVSELEAWRDGAVFPVPVNVVALAGAPGGADALAGTLGCRWVLRPRRRGNRTVYHREGRSSEHSGS